MHAGENRKTGEETAEETKKLIDAKPDVAEAKQRFLKAAENISPLGIVRRRPLASVGVAFLAGFGMSSLGKSRIAPPTLDTMAQIASIAAQFAPLIAVRARSSDG